MIYEDVITKQKDKMLSLNVRKTDDSRIMIQGNKDSLLYLCDYIKAHVNGSTCYAEVPLAVNLLTGNGDENDFKLWLHKLPCDESC